MIQQLNDKILLIDDDQLFCQLLANAFHKRGYEIIIANDQQTAVDLIKSYSICYAIIDLKLASDSGLNLITVFKNINPTIKIIILTGYASIATAIESIKLGAIHYLLKPIKVEEIIGAFNHQLSSYDTNTKQEILSAERYTWEYIQQQLLKFNGNISKTAKHLNMHRRTLQRKLNKRPVNN